MAFGTKIKTHDLRLWATEAQCDPRTVARAILGLAVQPMVLERIKRAAEKLGYLIASDTGGNTK